MALFTGKDKDLPLLTQFYALELPNGWEENFSLLGNPKGDLVQWAYPQLVTSPFGRSVVSVSEYEIHKCLYPLAEIHSWTIPLMNAIANGGAVPASCLKKLEGLLTEIDASLQKRSAIAIGMSNPSTFESELWKIINVAKEKRMAKVGFHLQPDFDGFWVISLDILPDEMEIPIQAVMPPEKRPMTWEHQIADSLEATLRGEIRLARCGVCGNVFSSGVGRKHRDAKMCSGTCRSAEDNKRTRTGRHSTDTDRRKHPVVKRKRRNQPD